MLKIDRDADTPLTEQIARQLARRIEEGSLLRDTRLPSVRQLASQLGVSVHTVLTAFDRLTGLGYLAARPGAGYYVTRPSRTTLEARDVAPDVESLTSTAGFARFALAEGTALLPVGSGYLPRHWYEDAISPATVSRTLKTLIGHGHAMAPPEGILALREQLAARLQRRQIPATAAHVLSTYGATQALQLAARLLAAPGDAVLVDDPGYFFLYAQLSALGVRVVSVPRRTDGPDLDALARACAETKPRAFFTQTLLHNPTGTNISPAVCHRLLNLADAYDFTLVEDDVYGDLADEHALRLAQIDGLRRVIYLGSFSKVYSPSLRVGYMAASLDMVDRLVSLKRTDVLGGSALEETLMAEALADGRLHRHASRQRVRLARARSASVAALAEVGVDQVDRHGDGIFMWCALPPGIDAGPLAIDAHRHGILLAAGTMFTRQGGGQDRLRMNAAYGAEPALLSYLKSKTGGARR